MFIGHSLCGDRSHVAVDRAKQTGQVDDIGAVLGGELLPQRLVGDPDADGDLPLDQVGPDARQAGGVAELVGDLPEIMFSALGRGDTQFAAPDVADGPLRRGDVAGCQHVDDEVCPGRLMSVR